MEKEELIKKLEKAEMPQIELPNHKQRLKAALIDWYYTKRFSKFLVLKRAMVPISALAIFLLAVFVFNNLIFPQDTLADARKIASENPQVRSIIKEENAEIKDIKIVNNTAYVLITAKTAESEKPLKEKKIFAGALVEVSLRDKKVSKIKEIAHETAPLTPEQEEKAKTIIMEIEQKTIEFEGIESLQAPSYDLKLIERDKKVEAVPKEEDKKARVIYRIGSETKEAIIDLEE